MRPRSRELMIGCALLAAVLGAATLGPLVYAASATRIDLQAPLAPPSAQAPGGRDALGRDVLSRALLGARISLAVGFTAVGFALMFGTLIGCAAGYARERTDFLLMRLTDVVLAFPGLLLAVALAAALGPSLTHVVIALAATGWTGYARL